MRRYFRILFSLNILVLPTVISAIAIPSDLTFRHGTEFLGFSGADASLFGGLLIASMLLFRDMFDISLGYLAVDPSML